MPQPLQMVFNVKTTGVIKQPVQSAYVKPAQVKNTSHNFMGLMGLVKSRGCSSCGS